MGHEGLGEVLGYDGEVSDISLDEFLRSMFNTLEVQISSIVCMRQLIFIMT